MSTIAQAVTAHYLLSVGSIVLLPEAYRRFGVGRVTFIGAVVACVGAIVWASAREPWQLVPASMLRGAGLGGDQRRGSQRHGGALVHA